MKTGVTINFVRQALSAAADGWLHFGMRNRIWDALTNDFPDTWAQRKAVLGHLVACETLPKWDDLDDIPSAHRRLPHEILNACRARILGLITESAAKEMVGDYDYVIDDFFCHYATAERLENCNGVWPTEAPYAAQKALQGAAWMTLRFEDYDTLDPMGPDSDVHFFACCDIVAENAPSQSRRYWQHWLDDLLPMVLREYRDVENALVEL